MTKIGHQIYADELKLPQGEAYQCDMLVWRNNRGLDAQNHPGHAALVIRRDLNEGPWHLVETETTRAPHPRLALKGHRYISFWPDDGNDGLFGSTRGSWKRNHLIDMDNEMGVRAEEQLSAGRYQPRDGQIVIGRVETTNGNGVADWHDQWGQKYQALVSMPGLIGARPDRLGLSLNRMINWAVTFTNSEDFHYIFASRKQNCAGVAVRAIQVAGGDAFARLGGNHVLPTFYTLPNDAQRWANSVRLGIDECNRMLAALRNRTRNLAISIVAGSPKRDLMTVEAWKSKSHIARTIRGRITSAIDKALRDYHEKDWARDYEKKLKSFVTIIKNVHDHLRDERTRESAYVLLAYQILGVVELLAQSGNMPWSETDFAA